MNRRYYGTNDFFRPATAQLKVNNLSDEGATNYANENSRASWLDEINDRFSWINQVSIPPLDDPSGGSYATSPKRLSWMSDMAPSFIPEMLSTGTQTVWNTDAGTQTADLRTIVEMREFETHSPGISSVAPTIVPTKAEPEWLDGWRLYLVAAGLMPSLLSSGLDRSILSVAIPAITSEFHSLGDIGWYSSAYLLTLCSFQLPYGKLFTELNKKYVYLTTVVLFLVGSVVCATARSSAALIVGRAVSGIGAGGMVSGTLIIVGTHIAPHRRPTWLGLFGAAANIAQGFGPLIGGAFVTNLSWRWCFWINLPLGGVTIICTVLFLRLPSPVTPPEQLEKSWWSRTVDLLDRLDAPGAATLIPAMVCLLLALQWGGSTYAWSSWRCILLLCLFSLLTVFWGYQQYRRGPRATVPMRIVRQRSSAFGAWYSMAAFGALLVELYYVPIWFQTVRGISALQSGINMCALVLPWAFTLMLAAGLTTRLGYYVPQMIAASVLMSVTSGLMLLFEVGTPTRFWVPVLIFFGVGFGLGQQGPMVAAQIIFKGPDIGLGTSLIVFLQALASSVMTSVGQNVLSQTLGSNVARRAPGVDPRDVISNGGNDLAVSMARIGYSPTQVDEILLAYNDSVRSVFVVAVALACLTAIGSAGMEWRSVKPPGPPGPVPPPPVPSSPALADTKDDEDTNGTASSGIGIGPRSSSEDYPMPPMEGVGRSGPLGETSASH